VLPDGIVTARRAINLHPESILLNFNHARFKWPSCFSTKGVAEFAQNAATRFSSGRPSMGELPDAVARL
jgi:hypothetical protein